MRDVFLFQAEDGIRYLVRSRGLGDVYKRQETDCIIKMADWMIEAGIATRPELDELRQHAITYTCLLYTSDAADERSSVDLGGRRIIKKKTRVEKTE
mgnify:CR=1 FL=1